MVEPDAKFEHFHRVKTMRKRKIILRRYKNSPEVSPFQYDISLSSYGNIKGILDGGCKSHIWWHDAQSHRTPLVTPRTVSCRGLSSSDKPRILHVTGDWLMPRASVIDCRLPGRRHEGGCRPSSIIFGIKINIISKIVGCLPLRKKKNISWLYR